MRHSAIHQPLSKDLQALRWRIARCNLKGSGYGVLEVRWTWRTTESGEKVILVRNVNGVDVNIETLVPDDKKTAMFEDIAVGSVLVWLEGEVAFD